MAGIDWDKGVITPPKNVDGSEPIDWSKGDIKGPAGFARKAGDLGLSVLKGAVVIPEAAVGLADIPTGGRVGKFLENEGGAVGFRPKQAKEVLTSFQSDDLRGKSQAFQSADGVLDKAGVALSNPSLITNAVAESVPLMGAGGVLARGLMNGTRLGAVGAGAVGEGVVGAGSAAEQIRQETEDGLLTPKQAALGAASGAATAGFGALGGKVAQRLGIGDVDTLIAQGSTDVAQAATQQAPKGFIRRGAEGAVAEGFLEELPQSLSEQAIQNVALERPITEGLADAAVMGTLAGSVMGAGAGIIGGPGQPPAPAPAVDPGAPPVAPTAPDQPPAGPQGFNPSSLTGTDPASLMGNPLMGSGINESMLPAGRPPVVPPQAPQSPSAALGIDPAAGPLSAAAAIAVDGPSGARALDLSGATPEDQAAYDAATFNPDTTRAAVQDRRRVAIEGMLERAAIQGEGRATPTVEDDDVPFDPFPAPADGAGSRAPDAGAVGGVGTAAGPQANNQGVSGAGQADPAGKPQRFDALSGQTPEAVATTGQKVKSLRDFMARKRAEREASNVQNQQAGTEAAPATQAPAGQAPATAAGNATPAPGVPAAGAAAGVEAAGLKSGDTVRVRGQEDKLQTVDAVGDDGYVYLKSGLSFPADKAAELLFKSESNAEAGTFGGLVSSPEDRTPSFQENKARWAAEGQQDAATPASGTAPAMVEHTTSKGKVLRGVVRKDMTLEQAKAIDPYAFKKDGGVFIREQHLSKLPASTASTDGTQTTQAQQTEAQGQKAPPAAPAAGVDTAEEAGADELGAQWNRMTTAEREAVATRAGLNPVARSALAKRGWQGLDEVQRQNLRKGFASAGKGAQEPRGMTFEGRATDGQPIKPGDTFKTSSGRATTAYPKQQSTKYASQWLIDNAVMEAQARGDSFNLRAFQNTKPLKGGDLTPADRDGMLEYLFGQQPTVVPSILKPLAEAETTIESAAQPQDAGADKRKNQALRDALTKDLAAMSDDEAREALAVLRGDALTSALAPQLGSKKAWILRERKAHEASLDVDSLKWVNDNMGHQAGDDLLLAVGNALADAGLDAYHVSGDEFYATSNDLQELQAGLAKAQKLLADAEISGQGLVFKGPGFSFGIAGTIADAETGLQNDKSRREREGLRAARGERPNGVSQAAQGNDAGGTGRGNRADPQGAPAAQEGNEGNAQQPGLTGNTAALAALQGKQAGDMLEMGNGTIYRIEGVEGDKVRLTRNPNMLSERPVLVAQDGYAKLLADDAQTRAEAQASAQAQANAQEAENRRAGREFERSIYRELVAMPEMAGKSIEDIAKAIRERLEARNALKGVNALQIGRLARAVQMQLTKDSDRLAKQGNRDPQAKADAIQEGLGSNYPEGGAEPAQQADFLLGFEHALDGKTKSTLSGDGLVDMLKGYEFAREWIATDEGKAWYEGKGRAKLKNTGVDLRRHWEALRAQMKASETDVEKAWKQIERATERAGLFSPFMPESATPGMKKYVTDFRANVTPFKKWLSNRQRWYGSTGWGKGAAAMEMGFMLDGSRYPGDLDEESRKQYKTDTAYRIKYLQDQAAEYLDSVQKIIRHLDGAKSVAEAAKKFTELYILPDQVSVVNEKGYLYQQHMVEEIRPLVSKYGSGVWSDSASGFGKYREGSPYTNYIVEKEATLELPTKATSLIPPKLDRVTRTGLKDFRAGADVTPAQFKEKFGFADVGFGNWVGARNDQDHLNYAYDAFMDLSRHFGIPPSAIGLGGRLHFTIGALGHGKHAAHFSPNHPGPNGPVKVINLTNTKGDGTVYHEWIHALDDMLGGDWKRVRAKIVSILSSRTYTAKTWEQTADNFLFGNSYWQGQKSMDKVRAAIRAMSYYNASSHRGQTAFKRNADQLGKDYWGNEFELLARSSEAWAADTLGGTSTYLVNPEWVSEGKVTQAAGYRGTPYPTGDERALFNQVLTAFSKAVKYENGELTVSEEAFLAGLPDSLSEAEARRKELATEEGMNAYRQRRMEEREVVANMAAAEKAQKAREEQEEIDRMAAEQLAALEPAVVDTPPTSERDGPLDEDDLSALFDQAAAELREETQENPAAPAPGEAPSAPTAPPTAPPTAAPRPAAAPAAGEKSAADKKASELIAEAAKLGVKGANEALTGLAKLFGSKPGRLNSFPAGFDEDTYNAAKPHFKAALTAFQDAGKSLKDLFKMLIQQFGDGIKDYAIQFAKDEGLTNQLTSKSAEQAASPSDMLANWVRDKLGSSTAITWQELFRAADGFYAGTQAEGKYTPKDAYDAMEAGMNRYILANPGIFNPQASNEAAQIIIARLERDTNLLATQTKRTAEQDEFQQFSTVPALAYAANWAANVTSADTMMEPSAGIGGLAVFAKNAGARLVLNELSARRAAVLREVFPAAKVYTENAEQINNILPESVQPSVVVMNPPFSATAGRMVGTRNTMVGAQHVEQALKRLVPGGRLVAITGEGMTMDKPAFKDWWKKISAEYDVRAVIPMDGSGYAKYGTTFNNALIIIDKVKPSGRAVVTTPATTYTELIGLLSGIRNDRPAAQQVSNDLEGLERDAAESALGQPDEGGQGDNRPAAPDGRVPGSVGNGRIGPAPLGTESQRGGTGSGNGRPGGAAGGNNRAGNDGRGNDGRGGANDAAPDGGLANGGMSVESSDAVSGELTDSIFESYQPQRLKVPGAQPHLGPLVQSSAMAAVLPPAPTYTPNLPKETIEQGKLSIAQIEAVVYAGQAHSETLPTVVDSKTGKEVVYRRGFFIGDGTGVGKGREIGGILLDNLRQGRKKAVWISEKQGLINDAKRDFKGVGGDESIIFNQNKTKAEDAISAKDGILFTAYSTLRSGAKSQDADVTGGKPATAAQYAKAFPKGSPVEYNVPGRDEKYYFVEADPKNNRIFVSREPGGESVGAINFVRLVSINGHTDFAEGNAVRALASGKHPSQIAKKKTGQSRLDQLIEWLGEDFDGVIAFDEAHNAGNAVAIKGERGVSDPSAQAMAVVELQKRLPNARVVYVSATGATQVSNLSYATRLGLWGPGTPFPSVENFIAEMSAGGLATMELVARDMKQMGAYLARSLSYDGVSYSRLEHELTPIQQDIYNRLAEAWQVTLRNMEKALEVTGAVGANGKGGGKAKAAAKSAYWGAQQRFFNQIITSMQMPTVIEQMERDVANGEALVLQLVNTNEAQQNRSIAKKKEEGESADLEDLDLTPRDQLLQMVEKSFPVVQHEEVTDSEGRTTREPVKDSEGNPALNREAVQMRDKLLQDLKDIRVPDGPLEMVLNHFGTEKVAEVTGRTQRVVRTVDEDGNSKSILETRGALAATADAEAFMADKKPILVFSDAGGTGFSFHADMTKTNQRKRKHYLIQPGWRADKAVQGFGRTHRTNQKSAPHYYLASTNIPAQKRFLSAIARRLDQLGALTKGQRDTANQGMFSEKDNLESKYATQAVRQFIEDLQRGQMPGVSFRDFLAQTGLEDIVDPSTNQIAESKIPETRLFLNRMLSLTLEMQDKVFDAFIQRMEDKIDVAIERGEFDAGLQTIKALESRVVADDVAYTDPKTGAETRLVELELTQPTIMFKFPEGEKAPEYVANVKSGRVYVKTKAGTTTNRSGEIVDRIRLRGTGGLQFKAPTDFLKQPDGTTPYRAITEEEARAMWEQENAAKPATFTTRMHMVVGAMLPIWDRLKADGAIKVARTQTVDGKRLLGMVIDKKSLPEIRKRLNISSSASRLPPAQIMARILKGETGELANGWVLMRVRVSNDVRIEVKTRGMLGRAAMDELTGYGMILERIQWTDRMFVPTGAQGVPVLEKLFQSKPVVDLIGKDDDSPGAGGVFSQGLLSPASVGPKPSLEQVQRLVDKVQGVAKNVMPVTVVGNPGQVSGLQVPAGTKPTGVLTGGRIYLFADNIRSVGEAYATLFHEAFHLGLQKVIPAEDYAALLKSFANSAQVQFYMRQWKASPEGVQRAAAMPSAAYEALATEEALAMVSEELATTGIGSNRAPALAKKMLAWLADVADRMGFPSSFSDWVRGLTRTEAEKFVSDMTRAAMGGQRNLARTQRQYGNMASQMTQQERLRDGSEEARMAAIFTGLQGSTQDKMLARRALKSDPRAEAILEVEANFMDILARLDDAKLVEINC